MSSEHSGFPLDEFTYAPLFVPKLAYLHIFYLYSKIPQDGAKNAVELEGIYVNVCMPGKFSLCCWSNLESLRCMCVYLLAHLKKIYIHWKAFFFF